MILFVQTADEMWLFTAHKRFLFCIENSLTAPVIFKIMKKLIEILFFLMMGAITIYIGQRVEKYKNKFQK